jgi:cytochrome P450
MTTAKTATQNPSRISLSETRRRLNSDGVLFAQGIQRDFGDAVYFNVPVIGRVYMLFRPQDIHAVLVSGADHVDKPRLIRRVLRSSFGEGLFSSGGALWKKQRKLIQPTFRHDRVGQYISRMETHTEKLLSQWHDGDTRIIDADMHHLTFEIVMDSLFTTDASANSQQLAQGVRDLGEGLAQQSMNIMVALLPDWTPLPAMRKKRRGIATIDTLIHEMVSQRQALGEANSPPDLLTAMLFAQDAETGEPMSERQLRDEVLTMVIAGHETTANTLSWAWAYLAQNPSVEAKLHAELDSVLGGRLPALHDLPNLPYVSNVIKETLRLSPPAWFIQREVTSALAIGETEYRKGDWFMLFPIAAHRDSSVYEQPDEFMPERWSEGFEKSLPKGTYFPFGMGPRVCIGNGFAMLEAQYVLAAIASRYRIEFPVQPAFGKGFTLALGFNKPTSVIVYSRDGQK